MSDKVITLSWLLVLGLIILLPLACYLIRNPNKLNGLLGVLFAGQVIYVLVLCGCIKALVWRLT